MSHFIDLFLSCGLTAGTNDDITLLRLRRRCITASLALVPTVAAKRDPLGEDNSGRINDRNARRCVLEASTSQAGLRLNWGWVPGTTGGRNLLWLQQTLSCDSVVRNERVSGTVHLNIQLWPLISQLPTKVKIITFFHHGIQSQPTTSFWAASVQTCQVI